MAKKDDLVGVVEAYNAAYDAEKLDVAAEANGGAGEADRPTLGDVVCGGRGSPPHAVAPVAGPAIAALEAAQRPPVGAPKASWPTADLRQ